MCVLGQFGDSDGHMEGRSGDCRGSPRKQRGGLCAGVLEDLARGSHRGSQNQSQCMFLYWRLQKVQADIYKRKTNCS